MQELFGSKTTVFVASFDAHNKDNQKAASQAGPKILSAKLEQEIKNVYDSDES